MCGFGWAVFRMLLMCACVSCARGAIAADITIDRIRSLDPEHADSAAIGERIEIDLSGKLSASGRGDGSLWLYAGNGRAGCAEQIL